MTVAVQALGAVLSVWLAGQLVKMGAWVSLTVTLKEQVLASPDASVALHTTVVTPLGNAEPLASPLCRLTEPPEQLSVMVGVA